MKSIRKMFAVSAISAASVAALLGAPELVRFGGNQAFAEDAQQGKVEKPQVSAQETQQLESLSSIFRKVGKSIEPAVVNITVRKSIKASRPQGYDDMLRRFFPDRDGDGEPELPEGFSDGGGGEGRGGGDQFGSGSGVVREG